MFLWWSYFGCLDKVSINHVCLISFAFISYSINVDHIALSIKCKVVHAYIYIYLHIYVLHVKNFTNVKKNISKYIPSSFPLPLLVYTLC